MRASVLRLTNTVGPGMRIKDTRQTFLGFWVRSILEGKTFEVWGGDQKRDFNFVTDVVAAMMAVAMSEDCLGKVYNLGGEPVTLKTLAVLLSRVSEGARFEVKEFPNERSLIDIGDYWGDYSRIRAQLGWEPHIGLAEALEKTVNYYQEWLSEYL